MFVGNRVVILLMQRDIADATVPLRGMLSQRHYDHFTALIARLAGDCTRQAVEDTHVHLVAGLILGYCELALATEENDCGSTHAGANHRKMELADAVLRVLRIE